MSGLISAEWLKVRKRRLPWILAACTVGIIALLYVMLLIALWSASSDDALSLELGASLEIRNIVRFGDSVVYRVVTLLALILAAVVTANEYHWRTVVLRSSWTGRRVPLLAATFSVVLALSCAGLAVGYMATTVVVIVAEAARGTLEIGDLGPWLVADTVLAIVRTLPALLVFVSAAVAIATLTRSSAAGIAIPLGVLLLEPLGAAVLAASDAFDRVAPFLLSRNIDALLAANGPVIGTTQEVPEGLPSAWVGALLLVMYGAVTMVITGRLVGRREVIE